MKRNAEAKNRTRDTKLEVVKILYMPSCVCPEALILSHRSGIYRNATVINKQGSSSLRLASCEKFHARRNHYPRCWVQKLGELSIGTELSEIAENAMAPIMRCCQPAADAIVQARRICSYVAYRYCVISV